MRTLGRIALALLVAVALPALAGAHEGHTHRIMGTVTSFDAGPIVLPTPERTRT